MIVVYTPSGERLPIPSGIRYCTDEHNNLEVFCGDRNNQVGLACFNEAHWERVVVEDGED